MSLLIVLLVILTAIVFVFLMVASVSIYTDIEDKRKINRLKFEKDNEPYKFIKKRL